MNMVLICYHAESNTALFGLSLGLMVTAMVKVEANTRTFEALLMVEEGVLLVQGHLQPSQGA